MTTQTPGGATAGAPLGASAPGTGQHHDNHDTDRPSLGALFSNITEDLSTLMRQEVALAKAEATESAKRAGKGAGMLSGAAVAGYFVLLFVSITLWQLLDNWMDSALAALIVAVIWGIVAAVLALKGKAEVKRVQGLPQTTSTVKKIPNALKGHEEENR
jgi:F0F1-type ATP synthase assembly protein I